MEAHNRLANEAARYGGGSYGSAGGPQFAGASIGLGPGGGYQTGLISPVSSLPFLSMSQMKFLLKQFYSKISGQHAQTIYYFKSSYFMCVISKKKSIIFLRRISSLLFSLSTISYRSGQE